MTVLLLLLACSTSAPEAPPEPAVEAPAPPPQRTPANAGGGGLPVKLKTDGLRAEVAVLPAYDWSDGALMVTVDVDEPLTDLQIDYGDLEIHDWAPPPEAVAAGDAFRVGTLFHIGPTHEILTVSGVTASGERRVASGEVDLVHNRDMARFQHRSMDLFTRLRDKKRAPHLGPVPSGIRHYGHWHSKSRETTLGLGLPTVEGGLDRGAIEGSVWHERHKLVWCHDHERNRERRFFLGGSLDAVFTVQPDGTVSEAHVENMAFDSEYIETCVARRLTEARFRTASKPTAVRIPMFFHPLEGLGPR